MYTYCGFFCHKPADEEKLEQYKHRMENYLMSKEEYEEYNKNAFRPELLCDESNKSHVLILNEYIEDSITLEKFLKKCNLDLVDELILKMDIESAEYEVLLDASLDTLKKFRIMVIEFHYFSKSLNPDLLLSNFMKIFNKLNMIFDIVHFHPNNCEEVFRINKSRMPRVVEITFHRKDRAKIPLVHAELPQSLDIATVPNRPEITPEWRF
jgi:FkbM family methyltransferase